MLLRGAIAGRDLFRSQQTNASTTPPRFRPDDRKHPETCADLPHTTIAKKSQTELLARRFRICEVIVKHQESAAILQLSPQ
jgi:hypothetical protein